jgi:hypothetical protein
MRTRLLATLLVLGASSAAAQVTAATGTLEIRPFVGAYVPVGAMRDEFKAATMRGVQGAMELSRHLHVLAGGSWTHGHSKLLPSNDVTYVWQYDTGVEANLVRALSGGWLWRPFAGLGVGGRTYDYRKADVATRTCTAGYGALGSELQMGTVGLRLEGRDYLSCYKSPLTAARRTRSDLGLSFGVAYHLR